MSSSTLTGWTYSLLFMTYNAITPYLHVTYPQHAILFLIIFLILFFCDFIISESPWKNLSVLNKNGFSTLRVMTYALITAFVVQFTWVFIARSVLSGISITYSLDIKFLFFMVITLILNDIYFYFAHKQLHTTKYGAILHELHHCCYFPSLSTGFMFNPIDLFIEFAGPNMILLIMYYFLNDPRFLVLTGCVILGWYGTEHDERVKFHHFYHHVHCDSDYPAYVKYQKYNANDKVKKLIKR